MEGSSIPLAFGLVIVAFLWIIHSTLAEIQKSVKRLEDFARLYERVNELRRRDEYMTDEAIRRAEVGRNQSSAVTGSE